MRTIAAPDGRAWTGRVTVMALGVLLAACSSAPAAPGASGTASGAATSTGPAATAGTATQPPAAGGSDGVCGLVAGAEVAAIVGAQLADTKADAATKTCTWSFPNGGYVTLTADPSNSDTSLAVARDFYDGEDVTGLGERAYWAKNVGMLIFVKGIVYTVQVKTIGSGPAPKEVATKIAQLVLAKV